jgi:hypothetical protein
MYVDVKKTGFSCIKARKLLVVGFPILVFLGSGISYLSSGGENRCRDSL